MTNWDEVGYNPSEKEWEAIETRLVDEQLIRAHKAKLGKKTFEMIVARGDLNETPRAKEILSQWPRFYEEMKDWPKALLL